MLRAAPAGPSLANVEISKMSSLRYCSKIGVSRHTPSEAGYADVHGLIQLDGADPTPFCRLKAVPSPLVRALQEAYVAVEQMRAFVISR